MLAASFQDKRVTFLGNSDQVGYTVHDSQCGCNRNGTVLLRPFCQCLHNTVWWEGVCTVCLSVTQNHHSKLLLSTLLPPHVLRMCIHGWRGRRLKYRLDSMSSWVMARASTSNRYVSDQVIWTLTLPHDFSLNYQLSCVHTLHIQSCDLCCTCTYVLYLHTRTEMGSWTLMKTVW